MALPAEFSLIARHFRPLAGPGALDLSDDAALLTPPPGRELVLTADAMVGRRAFPAGRSAGPGGAQAAAGQSVRPRREGGGAAGLSDDRVDAEGHAGSLVRRVCRRAGAGPGDVWGDAAGGRYDLDARVRFRCR